MQLLAKMNAKMDEGYKVTTFCCEFCNGVTLAKPNSGDGDSRVQASVYCPKCNKEYLPTKKEQDQDQEYQQYYNDLTINKLQAQQTRQQNNLQPNSATTPSKQNPISPQPTQILDPAEQQYQQFLSTFNSMTKTPSQIKSDQVSKKIGEKLISGWTMMESACEECNVPLMKSKKGNLICCGCDKDYAQANVTTNTNANKKDKSNIKQQKIQQKIDQQYKPKDNKTKQSPSYSTRNLQSSKPQAKIEQKPQSQLKQQNANAPPQELNKKIAGLVHKTLDFLQTKLDKAIQLNDLEMVDRVLSTIKKTKQLM